MGPVKANQQKSIAPVRKTRSQAALSRPNVLEVAMEKRKAEASPIQKRTTKRSAFGDLTNNACDKRIIDKNPVKNVVATKGVQRFKDDRLAVENSVNIFPKQKAMVHKGPLQSSVSQTSMKNFCKLVKPTVTLRSKVSAKPKIDEVAERIKAVKVTVPEVKIEVKDPTPVEEARRPSDTSENSLYVTALEEPELKSEVKEEKSLLSKVPVGVEDFDAENWTDPFQASVYAMDIFNYLKDREAAFPIDHYMERQQHLNTWMRSLLVDWMVEVQETFELNHETLYLAVKLVDLYLCKNVISKETLQLIGAASIFIASKYDEQIPPLVDDFLFICDGAYTQPELISMERNIVKSLDFNLGIPLSYRFLRRYARCGKVSMPDLTLARYILELSLMDYSFVGVSDSKLAAAALVLALSMVNGNRWTPTLEYYSGYKLADLKTLIERLNKMLHTPPKEKLVTIKTKYSHK
ncbi:G2/mitotic-specific cyclin-B3 isoform X2 [Anabrus simplex]